MNGSLVGPLTVVVLVVISDARVVWDATRLRNLGTSVTASVGPIALDRPERWLVACVLLWVVAFPLYLVARRAS